MYERHRCFTACKSDKLLNLGVTYFWEAEFVDGVHDPLAMRPIHRDERLQLVRRNEGRVRELAERRKLGELLDWREPWNYMQKCLTARL